jgi:leader peptidase (prepilin peptidase)/N-methyltransferase
MGLVVGSYVTTAALRSVDGEQSARGSSHCDSCGIDLTFMQTIPVLGFMGARGSCRACGARIDRLHLAGELAGGAIGAGATLGPPGPATALIAGLGLVLLAAAVIDFRTRRLPDTLTAAVAVICLLLSVLGGRDALITGFVAAAAAFLLLAGLRLVATSFGRDPGMGYGDVKLVSALALWLGAYTPWMLVGAALLGLLSVAFRRPADGRIAFGPMLAISSLAVAIGLEGGWWRALI